MQTLAFSSWNSQGCTTIRSPSLTHCLLRILPGILASLVSPSSQTDRTLRPPRIWSAIANISLTLRFGRGTLILSPPDSICASSSVSTDSSLRAMWSPSGGPLCEVEPATQARRAAAASSASPSSHSLGGPMPKASERTARETMSVRMTGLHGDPSPPSLGSKNITIPILR